MMHYWQKALLPTIWITGQSPSRKLSKDFIKSKQKSKFPSTQSYWDIAELESNIEKKKWFIFYGAPCKLSLKLQSHRVP